MRRLLITGGTGFIGRHLARYLANQGHNIHLAVRTHIPQCEFPQYEWRVRESASLSAIFAAVQPHICIHLAAQARPNRVLDEFDSQYENTILPALEVARAIPPKTELALFFGSCEEYGNGTVPFRENDALRSFSAYGWGKISAFHAVQTVFTIRTLPWCWVRPFLVFGPGQGGDRLIPSVINACLRDADVPLSPGEQTRDFLYIGDLCEMVGRIVSHPERATGQILNLCSGQPRRIKQVAQLIHSKVGRGRLCVGALSYRQAEAMEFFGSPELFDRLFGMPTLMDFEAAIALTIDSCRNQETV